MHHQQAIWVVPRYYMTWLIIAHRLFTQSFWMKRIAMYLLSRVALRLYSHQDEMMCCKHRIPLIMLE